MFKINDLLKEKFLKEIKRDKKYNVQVLQFVDELEQSLDKEIYEFNMEELYKVEEQGKKFATVVKKYIDFATIHGHNRIGINRMHLILTMMR